MAHIVFYEKPGCGGNARQKILLTEAGHTLDVRNLLAEPWTAERLRTYFADLPVPRWFNMAAPRVKSGDVQPAQVTADEALAMMLHEPLLIRRPLMSETQADGRASHMVGFETDAVDAWVGLTPAASTGPRSLEGCAAAHPAATCHTEKT